jgi:hypothetical protein
MLGVEWLGCLFEVDQRNRDSASPPVARPVRLPTDTT